MAFLHCHKCPWSQDDFWSFKIGKSGYHRLWPTKFYMAYNPISVFLAHTFGKHGYWRPRRVHFDKYVAIENKWKRSDPHSWWLILREFKRMISKFKNQKWWTERAFQRDRRLKIAACPNCGSKEDFDID